MIKIKNWNIKKIIEMILLFGYSIFFLKTILDGTVKQYVHPRVIPFMIFASLGFLLIGAFYFKRLGTGNQKGYVASLVFFGLPLLMAFSIPPQSFDSNMEVVGTIQLKQSVSISSNVNQSGKSSTEELLKGQPTTQQADQTPEKSMNLVLDDDHFVTYLNEIYSDQESYMGMPVEIIGFVYRDQDQFTDADQFVTARLMMVCCAADMQPVGLLCCYTEAQQWEDNTWVNVKGYLEQTELGGEMVPLVQVTEVEKTEIPEQRYVYPY